MCRLRGFTALFLFTSALSLLAQERQLSWDLVAVKAHLEADGRLRVQETQTMVFTGDWNGGERVFRPRPRQTLDFGGMSRVDAQSGAEIEMSQGSLDDVDHWDLIDGKTLRWRARQPSDPVFNGTRITYVLRYALSNVLQSEDDRFVLDHDFAFSDRKGPIDHFRLELTLDPVWQPFGALQGVRSVDGIPPGKSFVLRVPLRYTGTQSPQVDGGLTREVKWMLLALAIVSLLLLMYAFLREQMLGRLDPPQAAISRAWLQQHLLRERAEVIGAMWDEQIGAAEVSSTLARMVGEGRLKSEVAGDEMSLSLLSRAGLDDYEKALIDALFVSGDHTSTTLVRSHYADRGFDPVTTIKEGLGKKVQERLPKGEVVKPSGLPIWLLFLASIAAFVYAITRNHDDLKKSAFIFLGGLVVSLFTVSIAWAWQTRKLYGIVAGLFSILPAALVTGGIGFFVRRSSASGSPELSLEMQLALTLYGLWIFAASVHSLRSRDSRESIAFRKMLGAAREYFRTELRKERPSLDDAWYPYLLAFGLNNEVKGWFKAFPAAAVASSRSDAMSTHTTTSSSSTSSPTWTGGGGNFGGAGASGTWAMAASGIAAGVAAPSSSSSDGGSSSSSSSGGSSGGGGGGGW